MTIRPANEQEIHAAIHIWAAANPASESSRHPARLRSWARLPGALLAVAEDNDGSSLIAMGLALPGRADDGAGELIPGLTHLTGICVLPEAQGQGVGSRLLDYLLNQARASGHDRATLWTHAHNPRARRLFESHGFRPTGRISTDDLDEQLIHYETLTAPATGVSTTGSVQSGP